MSAMQQAVWRKCGCDLPGFAVHGKDVSLSSKTGSKYEVTEAKSTSDPKEECQHTTSGFAKLGGGVTTQISVGTKTAGDNPDGVWLNPQLRKAASPLGASDRECSRQKVAEYLT